MVSAVVAADHACLLLCRLLSGLRERLELQRHLQEGTADLMPRPRQAETDPLVEPVSSPAVSCAPPPSSSTSPCP